MVRKARYMKRGDLHGTRSVVGESRSPGRAGVRVPIVATKRGNSRGAKGHRKVDAEVDDVGRETSDSAEG